MKTNLKGRDFITMKDYSREELETILEVAFDLKMRLAVGEPHPLLAGKNLGMIFLRPSTRTRISFETGMSQLGGHAQYYAVQELQVGGATGGFGEAWPDTARVMSGLLDGLVCRGTQDILKTLADNATIPVINAATELEHPCQVMADIMTMIEKLGPDYKTRKVVMHWVPSLKRKPIDIPLSLLIAGGTLGMNLTFTHPDGFELDPGYLADGKRLAEQSGGSIEIEPDKDKAVKDASVIYAKSWFAPGKTAAEDLKLQNSLRHWIVKKEDFDCAAPNAILMHPMPIERGMEATSEVVDDPISVLIDEAWNRLHTQKAIMSLLM